MTGVISQTEYCNIFTLVNSTKYMLQGGSTSSVWSLHSCSRAFSYIQKIDRIFYQLIQSSISCLFSFLTPLKNVVFFVALGLCRESSSLITVDFGQMGTTAPKTHLSMTKNMHIFAHSDKLNPQCIQVPGSPSY